MKKFKRVFLIVLDSLGVGALPDAADFGDEGSDTLSAVMSSPYCDIPTLTRMGLRNIDGSKLSPFIMPSASYGRAAELSRGKDTTIGHWEIAGVISKKSLPTYPDGFPDDIIAEFSRMTGRGVLCNRPASGTEVIKQYGEEHMRTGSLIVYTSADSVFQIAAHEDIVPPERLYEYCRAARKILSGENAVGRVIARPFAGKAPDFYRTPRRHDFSLTPPGLTMLDKLSVAGYDVIAVGKINDIFAGRGITDAIPTVSNKNGMEVTDGIAARDFRGLCFVNLVDFDMLYGHRNDTDGYAKALSEFDAWFAGFCERMKSGDLVIVTADHGCDPSTPSTDHSREYIPIIAAGEGAPRINLGTRCTYADIAASICENFGIENVYGTPFFGGEE
ncbi:MAG: phosphopentomutase [Eubacteriales bacterium]